MELTHHAIRNGMFLGFCPKLGCMHLLSMCWDLLWLCMHVVMVWVCNCLVHGNMFMIFCVLILCWVFGQWWFVVCFILCVWMCWWGCLLDLVIGGIVLAGVVNVVCVFGCRGVVEVLHRCGVVGCVFVCLGFCYVLMVQLGKELAKLHQPLVFWVLWAMGMRKLLGILPGVVQAVVAATLFWVDGIQG